MTAPAELDALIERLTESATQSRAHGWDGDAKDLDAAASALVQLREENARLEIWGKATFEAGFQERQRAERAEAEVARLTWYKSRADDIVRYLSMKPPQITAVEAVIAELTLRAAKERP
jgi:hypothetical protein